MSTDHAPTAKHTVFAPAHMSPAEGERIALLMEQAAVARSERRRRQRRTAILSSLAIILVVISLFAATTMLTQTADSATGNSTSAEGKASPQPSSQ
jgi:hypothetical protein